MSRLRAASASDCADVYALNFAPDVRAVSATRSAPPYTTHAAWFARRLATPSPIWMIEDAGDVVGVVRIDDGGKISIALAGRARGKGIGRRAIAAACAQWGRPVIAEIDPRNAASRACFIACGFVASGMAETGLCVFTWRAS